MRKQILPITILSSLIIGAPIVSCSHSDNDKEPMKQQTNEVTVSAKTYNPSLADNVKKNYKELSYLLEDGITERNLNSFLTLLGYAPNSISVKQFDRIYSEIVALDLSDISTVDELLTLPYFDNSSKKFKEGVTMIFEGENMEKFFDSPEFKRLSESERLILSEVYKGVPKIETFLNTNKYQANSIQVNNIDRGARVGVSARISAEAGTVLAYTIAGGAIGARIGGAVGCVVGAVVGTFVGLVAVGSK